MAIVRDKDLPDAGSRGLALAGSGLRLDKNKRHPLAWIRQLYAWGLTFPKRPKANARRLWFVTCVRGKRKIERTLPGGKRIRLFEGEGLSSSFGNPLTGLVEGPHYWLTYRDAEALWRDKDTVLSPACERLKVRRQGKVA